MIALAGGLRIRPVRAADLYMGETYDARKELGAWSENGYDDSAWSAAVVATGVGTSAPRVPQTHAETKAHAAVASVSVRSLGSGRYVFDLGKEIGGVVRLSINGTAGQQVTLRHAPRLLPSGDAYFLLDGAERSLLVPQADRRDQLWTSRVWPGALLVDGEIRGTWRRAQHTVRIDVWGRLSRTARAAVEAEAAALPLPIEREIAVVWAND